MLSCAIHGQGWLFQGMDLVHRKEKSNKSAISHRQPNHGATKHSIDVPAQTVGPGDSQSVPWSAQQQGQTLQSREL